MQLLLRYEIGECRDCGEPVYWDECLVSVGGELVCSSCAEDYQRCDECGNWELKEDLHETADGDFVCDSCKDDHYETCYDCGVLFRRDRMVYVECRDDYVCSSCLSENYRMCYDCEEYFPIDEMRHIGGERFCENCAEEWVECEHCENCVRRDDSRRTSSGDVICDCCYEDQYFTCERCEEVFHIEHSNIIDGCYYCDSCAEEENEDGDSVMSYHAFKDRDLYLRRRAKDEEFDPKELCFGVELECELGEYDGSDFSDWFEDGHLVHFEHDGSLNCEGIEMITQPCTLRFHQNEMDWNGLVGKLLSQGFRSSFEDSNCGLHVHMSRRALKPTTITKMDVFINRGKDFFSQIARREVFYNTQYDTIRRMSVEKGVKIDSKRYTAVNTSNPNTVEVRIFKGTLKTETILGTLEMLHALVRFLDYVPFGHLYETDANIVKCVEFCSYHSEEYPNVMPMMRRLVRHGVARANIEEHFARIERRQKGVSKCA